MNWNIVIIVICIVLTAWAGWKEYARKNKARLGLRIIAVMVAAIALACIALPLTYQTEISKNDRNEVILVTKGFDKESLKRYKGQKLYVLDRNLQPELPKTAQFCTLTALTTDSTAKQVHILGDGLDKTDLDQLNHLPVIFYPQEINQGITAISWNEKLKAGEALNIQGRFKNSSTKKVKIILKGLSSGLDSAMLNPEITTGFHLSTTPKTAGRYVYHLLATDGADTLVNEPVPVQIEPIKPLKVLMLTASPDFESRFLKNWLSAKGYAVATRSAISKDKYNTEFINLEQFPLDHLSASVLDKFDVLVGDLSVLKSLNGTENAILQQEVSQKGLGIIVRADSTLRSNSWLQHDFPSDRLEVKNPAPVTLILQGKADTHAKLQAGQVYINHQNNTQALVTEGQGHLLAATALSGQGRLIFTPLNNTFSWMLSGNEHDYSTLWSLLISKASRKIPVTESWSVLSAIPSVSNPIQLQLESAAIPSQIKTGTAFTSPQQDNQLPFEWQINYHAHSTGWHTARQNSGLQAGWYAYANDAWKSIRTLQKQADTKAYIAENAIVNNVTKQIHEKVTIAVSKVYFYVLLLIACVFLWVEAKF